jgi:hypothetical protein
MTSNSSRTPRTNNPAETPVEDTKAADAPVAEVATEAPAVQVEPAADDAAPAGGPSEVDPNKVKIKLANPLDRAEDLRRLGLDENKVGGYKVHDEILVTRDLARTLITAGYAQVDPEDATAVAAALSPTA